ncbi:MAG: hypothetical protein M3R59_05985, partial [Verrucomicrobiota bacterium]|nr:hypothetical protein [Verrucomicrobiota bacterium]
MTEGEKAASVLHAALGVITTTSAHGAKSPHKSDWSSLQGRDVVILPDNDPEGAAYAGKVAEILLSFNSPATIRIVNLPDLPVKGDVVEWLDEKGQTPADSILRELELLVGNAGECSPPEPVADEDATALRATFFELERQKGPVLEKRREMASYLIKTLHKRGHFFYHREIQDHRSALFFDAKRKLLLKLSDPSFLSWLARFTAINRSEREFDFLLKAIEDEALQGKSKGIVPEIFWAARPDAIYISNGDGGMVRVTPGKVECVDNGTDDILFAAGDTLPVWEVGSASDPFDCAVFGHAQFQSEHGLDLLRLWTISLPANLGCKPPLTVTGQIRSGKTMLIRGIFKLFGFPDRICEPTQSEEGKR